MIEESNNNPWEYCKRIPKAALDTFDFPGEYVNNLKLDVYTQDCRNLDKDYVQLIMPKGEITWQQSML